jgi:hypothetical protein
MRNPWYSTGTALQTGGVLGMMGNLASGLFGPSGEIFRALGLMGSTAGMAAAFGILRQLKPPK